MTINLSQHAGGGALYVPAMIGFDGFTDKYRKTGGTSSGNKVTAFGLIYTDTGGIPTNTRCIMRVKRITGSRLSINIPPNDHATTQRRNKLEIFVQSNTATILCRVGSVQEITDSLVHSFFFSFDGDTGVMVFEIDMVNAIDLAYPIYSAPITGTLPAGSDIQYDIGNYEDVNYFAGALGFLGQADAIWGPSDVFNTDGSPKDIDGSNTRFYNPHGQMNNSYGSEGDFTPTGNELWVSEVNATGHPILGINTIGDAVAADIATGKIAWVNGVEIVGTG